MRLRPASILLGACLSAPALMAQPGTAQTSAEIITCDDGSRVLLVPAPTAALTWISLYPTWTKDGHLLPQGLAQRLLAAGFTPARRRGLDRVAARLPRPLELDGHVGLSIQASPRRLEPFVLELQALRTDPSIPADQKLEPSQVLACLQTLRDPQRSIQVLFGRFDSKAAKQYLLAHFKTDADAARPVLPPLEPARPAVGGKDSVLLRMSALDLPRRQLDLVTQLAFAPGRGLELTLHSLGATGATVELLPVAQAPGGPVWVRLRLPGEQLGPGHALITAAQLALDAIQAADPLPPQLWNGIEAQLQARDADILRRPDGPALWLARRWARTGHLPGTPAATRDETESEASPAQLRLACRRFFATANRKLEFAR